MKKLIFLIFVFFLIISSTKASDDIQISSKEAVLYNLDTGNILYEKNKDEKIPVASLTKLMTALVAVEKINNIDSMVIIKKEDLQDLDKQNLVIAGFTNGEVVTYRDLLAGLLLPSGADAAMALMHNLSSSEEEFINSMNQKVKQLNLKNTHFSNPIGLDDENNYSSAYDISVIFKEVLKNKNLKEIITSRKYKTSDGKLTFKSTIQSNAKRYNIQAPYIKGGKTGTTTGAGLCLATIAKENGVNYMLVTTGALYDKKFPHHIEDAKTIYEYYINNYGNKVIAEKTDTVYKIKTQYLKEDYYNIKPNNKIIGYLPNDYSKKDITYEFIGLKIITSNTKVGEKIGTLKVYYQNNLLTKQNIYLNQKLKFSFFKYVKQNIFKYILIFIILALIIIIFLKLHKFKKWYIITHIKGGKLYAKNKNRRRIKKRRTFK